MDGHHDDSMVDALVGGADVSLSSRDILKWSEGVSVHAPDFSEIRVQAECSLDIRELTSALDRVDSNSRVPSPDSATASQGGGSSTAGSVTKSPEFRDNLRINLTDSFRDSVQHSVQQCLKGSLCHCRRASGGSFVIDERPQQVAEPAGQALRSSTNTNGRSSTSGGAGGPMGSSFSSPSSMHRSSRSIYRERLESVVPLSLRNSPAVLAAKMSPSARMSSPSVRRSVLDSPALRHARRGSSPFLPACAPDASMLDATFHPPEIGDRTYDALESAVTANAHRRKTTGIDDLRVILADHAKSMSPSTSPAVSTFPLSPRNVDARACSPAPVALGMDKSTFIRRLPEDSESMLRETALLDSKSFALTPPHERRDTVAPLPSARASRFAQPSAPVVREYSPAALGIDKSTFIPRARADSESPLKESALLDTKSFALTPPQERRDTLAPLPSAKVSGFAHSSTPRFQQQQQQDMPNQTERTMDLGRLVKADRLDASRLPGSDTILGSELADLSIASDEEMIPDHLRPNPPPRSASTRNLAEQLEPRTITDKLREIEHQRELSRARSQAVISRRTSTLVTGTPRKDRTADVPVSLRKERPSAPPATGRPSSTMAPPNALRTGAASRGSSGFPRSSSSRDLALGTGPSRMSAPATTETRRTLPRSESARRMSALPSSSSSRRLSAMPPPESKRRPPMTVTRRQSMAPPRNERADAATARNQPSRTSTISRTESTHSLRRQSTVMSRTTSQESRGERDPVAGGRKSTMTERSDKRPPPLLSRANSTDTRRTSMLPRSESAQSQEREGGHRLRPSASAGIPRSMTSRNIAASPSKRASAPPAAATREALGTRRSFAPAPAPGPAPVPTTKRRSMLPSMRSTTALRQPARESRDTVRTRSDTTSAVSATTSTVPSLCSAPTIDSHSPKLSAPPSEPEIEWLPPPPEAMEMPAPMPTKSVLQPRPDSSSHRVRRQPRVDLSTAEKRASLVDTIAPRPRSREHNASPTERCTVTLSGSGQEVRVSGGSSLHVSWNESLHAPIRNGHVEEMRSKYGHRTVSGRGSAAVGGDVGVDEMGRALGGRVQASTVGSLRRFR